MRAHSGYRWLAAIVMMSAVQGGHAAHAERLSVVLTGQSLIQSDIRTDWPKVVSEMRPMLKGDVVFTNFETMIVEPGGSLDELPGNNMGHHGPPEMLDVLKEMGFNLYSTANNHAYDLRTSGVFNNIREMKARGLTYAGTGADVEHAVAPGYLDTPHGRVAFIAMATGAIREDGAATESKPGVAELPLEGEVPEVDAGHPREKDALRILKSITDASKTADLVITSHHNHSYDKNFVDSLVQRRPDRLVPPHWIKIWAHREVDAGADIVVLHGVPVMQGIEIYHGRPIFYDMGNFIFQLDTHYRQIFTDPFVYQSVIAHVEFDKHDVKAISFQPIAVRGDIQPEGNRHLTGIPSPAKGKEAQEILHRLVDLSRGFGTVMSIKGDTAVVDVAKTLAAKK